MRIARENKTTFASSYPREMSLAEALMLDAIADYGRQTTGTKYLINPNKACRRTSECTDDLR